MKEDLNVDRIVNEIRMVRAYPGYARTVFLIVEGITDEKVYQHFVTEGVQIEIGYSKDNVIQALSNLRADNFQGVLAIIDADFMLLGSFVPSPPDLLLTDSHDLETMILQSPALEKVLDEFGSKEKIDSHLKSRNKDVRSLLLECARPVGYLRWLSIRDKLSLRFEGLDFDRRIVTDGLMINIDALIRRVQSLSDKQIYTDEDIKTKLLQLQDPSHDPWLVCCGHDMIRILSFGLRRSLGTTNSNDTRPELLEKCLRLAYEWSYFCETRLYAAIRLWEKQNEPFVILRIEGASLN